MPLTSLQLELRGLYPRAAMAAEDYVCTFEVSSPSHDNPFVNAVVGRYQRVLEEDALGRSCYVHVSDVGERSLFMWFDDASQGWVITFDDWTTQLAWGPGGVDASTPNMIGWHAPVATPQAQLMQCLFVGMMDTQGNTLPEQDRLLGAAAPAGEEDLAPAGEEELAGDEEDADVYERDGAAHDDLLDAEPPEKLVPRPPRWPPSRRTVDTTNRPRSPKTKRPRSPSPIVRTAPAGSAPTPWKKGKKQAKSAGGMGPDGTPTYEKGGFSSAQECRNAIKEKSNGSEALRKAGGWFDKAQALIELLIIDDDVKAAKRLAGRLYSPCKTEQE